MGILDAPIIPKDSTGRRLDAFEVSAARAATGKLRPVALRPNHYGNSTYLSTVGNTSATYRVQHFLVPGVKATGLRLLYGNFCGSNTPPNDITVAASLEIAGKSYSATFGGQLSTTIKPRQTILSDPIWVDLDASNNLPSGSGPFIYSRTYVSVADNTKQWPVGLSSNAANGEGSSAGAPGTDLTGNGFFTTPANPTTANSLAMYSPLAILGQPVPATTAAVCIIGDSISIGTGDGGSAYGSGDTKADYGFIVRALNRNIPYTFIAKYGEKAMDLGTTRQYRSMVLDYSTHVLCEYGINDVQGSVTLANLQAYMLNLWRMCQARGGLPVWQTTLMPVTTTTDGWSTLAGQTTHANNGVRTQFNDWIRAGAPVNASTLAAVAIGTAGALLAGSAGHPLTGYFEVADKVESARNSGLWAVHARARTFTDGAITTATPTLTSASAAFTSADVGRQVIINGAGGGAGQMIARVQSVESGTSVTLSTNASTTVSAATVYLGAFTVDGIHPDADGHISAATALDVSKFVI